jgi:hypothetical protein
MTAQTITTDADNQDRNERNGSTMDAANCFIAWNEEANETQVMTRAEMVRSLTAQAHSLGRGTPACGEMERKALEVAQGGTAGYTTVAALREIGGVW